MFIVKESNKKKLSYWFTSWQFKNKNHFMVWHFLRCVICSMFINFPIPLITYYHCGYKLSGAENFYLLVYSVIIMLLMFHGTYKSILKYKKLE